METGTTQEKITLAFINDKSPTLDITCNELIASGIEVLFRSENIKDGLSKLNALKALPIICIIDLDFYSKEIIQQLQEVRTQYPSIKLIAHSDIDADGVVKVLLNLGFSGYVLIADKIDKAIEAVFNGKKYLSAGITFQTPLIQMQ